MQQFVLTTSENIQSVKLIEYLQTLDFISLKPAAPRKIKKGENQQDSFVNFLESLPSQDHDEQEVVEAIKEMRRAG
ncbi:MAG: hypothetical protein NWQ46_05245 [Spirosomaceae bacterium]|nr:hypothetical protein [Spirosomataceae bacterium]